MEMEAGVLLGPCRSRTRGSACVHELITSACMLHRLLLGLEGRVRELKEKARNEIGGEERRRQRTASAIKRTMLLGPFSPRSCPSLALSGSITLCSPVSGTYSRTAVFLKITPVSQRKRRPALSPPCS